MKSSSLGVAWHPIVVPKVLRPTTLSELATLFASRALTPLFGRVSSLKLTKIQSCLKIILSQSSPVWIRFLPVTSNLLIPGLPLTSSNPLAESKDFSASHASRNASACDDPRCQIYSFVSDAEDVPFLFMMCYRGRRPFLSLADPPGSSRS